MRRIPSLLVGATTGGLVTMPVTVVVVHWNQADRCADTIRSFLAQGEGVRVIVVDNGSSLDQLQLLRRTVRGAPGADLVELGSNTGFGPAANVGLRRWLEGGVGEWALVAPHDALPHEGCIATLCEVTTEQRRAGLACADVGDGCVPVVDPYFGGMAVPASVLSEGWVDVDYPHGTLLLARRQCLEEIGLFDERYFAYCEEADLGIRAREGGWEVGLVRGARVTNPTMRSGSPAVDYLMHRNTFLLVREHFGRYHAAIRISIAIIQLLAGLVRPSPKAFVFSARGRIRGLIDHLRGQYGPPPEHLMNEAGEPALEVDPTNV